MAPTGKMLVNPERFLGFQLLFSILIERVLLTVTENNCNCITKTFWYNSQLICEFIDTKEEANCARQYINSKGLNSSLLIIKSSDMEQFPDNFILPDNVTDVEFWYCKMATIPKSLLQSICPSLSRIHFLKNSITDTAISDDVFTSCKNLRVLFLWLSDIKTVSRNAFSGLLNLRHLDLSKNDLESFEGFNGIDNLEVLDLSVNNITFIEKNAFQAMKKLTRILLCYNQLQSLDEGLFRGLDSLTDISLYENKLIALPAGIFQGLNKLTSIHLSDNQITTLEEGLFDPFLHNKRLEIALQGNPFYCNCSLKWLQDLIQKTKWFEDRTLARVSRPHCSGPVAGDLGTMNFCNSTTENPKPTIINMNVGTTATPLLTSFLLAIAEFYQLLLQSF